ncbi:MAG: hypothetical protein DCC43_15910 [Candidatus Brocadia sp.]|nr:hypothetical protein [Candidatus Brocadia sp. AMX3]RIJ88659.1 MAG: hypothetical protein DCC43_15910 [Candidatus Brocadia sp.]
MSTPETDKVLYAGAFPIFCKSGRQKTAEECCSAGILPPAMQARCLCYPFKLWVYKKSGMLTVTPVSFLMENESFKTM